VRRKIGIALAVVGAFLLVASLLSRFYAYDRLAVVPLNQDTTSLSEATDATVFDIPKGREVTVDLLSTRNVVGDVAASKKASQDLGRDVAVWETAVFTADRGAEVDEDHPPRSASHDRVAFDRHTGEAVVCCGQFTSSSVDPDTGEEIRDTTTPITGLYYKFPFETRKRDYTFWDGSLQKSTRIAYQGTESIKGLTVYRFEQVIPSTAVGDITAPASLFGIKKTGDVKLTRMYANTRTLWIEPRTGVIIRGQEKQDVGADYRGAKVATLTDTTIGYNDKTVAKNVDTYGSLATQLQIVRFWLPVVGGILGLTLLVLGLVMARERRRGGHAA
jgi:hypothetical protein